METREAMRRVVRWINQAESRVLQGGGSYANGGRAARLRWMKNTLLNAPTEGLQRELLDHWTRTGALPRDLLDG